MDLDAAEEFRLSFKYYQGAVYYKRQMFKEALQAFSAIISNDYAKTRYYYGKILLAEGQLENAVNYFHRTDHTSTSLYLELANVEFERSKSREFFLLDLLFILADKLCGHNILPNMESLAMTVSKFRPFGNREIFATIFLRKFLVLIQFFSFRTLR
jgi:tetratricopeptide (TPR) repeat protein